MPVLVDVAAPTRRGWTGGMGDGDRAPQTRHDRDGDDRDEDGRDEDGRDGDGRRPSRERVTGAGRGGG
jgi:hypothetical protein